MAEYTSWPSFTDYPEIAPAPWDFPLCQLVWGILARPDLPYSFLSPRRINFALANAVNMGKSGYNSGCH
jgi:hypothetical protein